ncbi:MAG TPA: FAD-binding protein [Gemmatimonadales bacterium]|nr:FAD-binding protein [Gemmatimonadales bacterium]
MNRRVSRREFVTLAATAGGAAIIGFDRSTDTQIGTQSPSFQGLPNLDGKLLLDDESRRAIAVDNSNLFHRIPAAVLKPGSAQDVVRIVQYANRHSLKVAVKGDGHSQYGQTQVAGGIVIDSRTLNTVHGPTALGVDVQPGAYWGDIVGATRGHAVTPPVYPATCMALTVGGTLSVGGIGNTSHRYGAQVDNVLELDVVTGDGRLVTCSPDRETELFNMVLAGLGQCAIIVRARLRLMPAPSDVMIQQLTYTDLDTYLGDQLRVARDGRYDHIRGGAHRKDGRWTFTADLGKYFTPPEVPDMAALRSGLRFESATTPVQMSYAENLFRFEGETVGPTPSATRRAFFTVWTPASTTKEFVSNILALPPELTGLPRPAGVERFPLYALNTGPFGRPLFKMPHEEQAFAIWLFRSFPANNEAALSAMLQSNRDLFAKMTALGGKRYTPYSGIMSAEDWVTHFGPEVWRRLATAKREYDPNQVLSPGAGMFGRPTRSVGP